MIRPLTIAEATAKELEARELAIASARSGDYVEAHKQLALAQCYACRVSQACKDGG